MKIRRLALPLVVMSVAAVLACTRSVRPRDLVITLQANRATAATGDTVIFTADVEGRSLVNVTIHFGDGTEDFYNTNYSQTATIQFRHAYDSQGTFVIDANVLDAVSGTKTDTVQVMIN